MPIMTVLEIKGEKVQLRSIQETDTDNIVRWRNSWHVKSMLFTQDDLLPKQHTSWLKNYVETGKCIQFIITDKDINRPVGTTFLKNIDTISSSAEFGIFIGEQSGMGKGLGYESTCLMLRYGLETLNLKKIYLSVFKNNKAAVNCYLKAGFLVDFIERDGYIRDNTAYSIVHMSAKKYIFPA